MFTERNMLSSVTKDSRILVLKCIGLYDKQALCLRFPRYVLIVPRLGNLYTYLSLQPTEMTATEMTATPNSLVQTQRITKTAYYTKTVPGKTSSTGASGGKVSSSLLWKIYSYLLIHFG